MASGKSLTARVSSLPAALLVVVWVLGGLAGCRSAAQAVAPAARGDRGRFDLPAHDFIYVGMAAQPLTKLVGEPREMERAGPGEVWYYPFGVVVLAGGKVQYKYPPSRSRVLPDITGPEDNSRP